MSCLGLIGTTPALLVRPTVGLIPTTELQHDGLKMEPSVSLPRDTVTRFAATDIADPLLDPEGSSPVYGFCNTQMSLNIVIQPISVAFQLDNCLQSHKTAHYSIKIDQDKLSTIQNLLASEHLIHVKRTFDI